MSRFTIAAVLLVVTAFAGCASDAPSPSGDDSSSPVEGAGPAGATPTSTTTSASSATSGSSGSSSSTKGGTTSSGTSSNGATAGNASAATPTPVSAMCSAPAVFVGGGGSASCTTDNIVSDTGGSFTAAHATFTFTGAAPNGVFEVLNETGVVLGAATGSTSPITLDLAADKVPTVTTFTLTGRVTLAGATVLAQGSVTFDLS